jgi:DNA-binding transcriptional ArsR family regulator
MFRVPGEVRYPRTFADLARLVSCETRVEIVCYVSMLRTNVTAVADALSLDVPSVSNHLRVLRLAGCVACMHEQRQRFYVPGPIMHYRSESPLVVVTLRATDGSEMIMRTKVPGAAPISIPEIVVHRRTSLVLDQLAGPR